MAAIEQIDFKTPMVKLTDDNSAVATPLVYPYYLDNLLADNTNISIGSTLHASSALKFHLAPVHVDTKPTTDQVVEVDSIVLQDDGYHQTWKVRPYTDEELEALFEADRAERFEMVQALEDTRRQAARTYEYIDTDGKEQAFTTCFETDVVIKWMSRHIYLTTQAEENTVHLYPEIGTQVITTAKEALRVVNQYFIDFAELMDKLNLHRFNLETATRATGLPSYPDWIA